MTAPPSSSLAERITAPFRLSDAPTRLARGSRYEDLVLLHQPGGTRGLRCRRCGVGELVRPFTVHLPVDGGGVPT